MGVRTQRRILRGGKGSQGSQRPPTPAGRKAEDRKWRAPGRELGPTDTLILAHGDPCHTSNSQT